MKRPFTLFLLIVALSVHATEKEHRVMVKMGTVICIQEAGLPHLRADIDKKDQHALVLDYVGYQCMKSDNVIGFNPVYVVKTGDGQVLVHNYPFNQYFWVPVTRLKPVPPLRRPDKSSN